MVDENPANDEYAILGFHLATHFTCQSPATCFDLPRCQRGGKRALQSGRCGRDYVVERSGARLLYVGRVQTVMLGDCPVNSKVDRRRFCRQLGGSYRARSAFDFHFGNIGHFGHDIPLSRSVRQKPNKRPRAAAHSWRLEEVKCSIECGDVEHRKVMVTNSLPDWDPDILFS